MLTKFRPTLFLLIATSAALSAKSRAGVNISGFQAVTRQVFRGGRPQSVEEFRQLAKLGIHTVVNLQGLALAIIPGEQASSIQNSKETAQRLGLRYFHLPFPAATPLNDSDKKMILESVRVMEDPQLLPVYVHCNVGADRTGIVVAAYRILHQNCSFEKASQEIMNNGEVWTPLFVDPQLPFLHELAANPARFGHPRTAERCPL